MIDILKKIFGTNFIDKLLSDIGDEKQTVIGWHLTHIGLSLLIFGLPALILWSIFIEQECLKEYLLYDAICTFLIFIISEWKQSEFLLRIPIEELKDKFTDLNQYSICFVIPLFMYNIWLGFGDLLFILIVYRLTYKWTTP
jgi:hypothetical protein